MRIITWNINSVRLRLPLLLELLAAHTPDIVALQEIKCETVLFPTEALAAAGYPHQHIWGMKAYNGVAVLSRQPFDNPRCYDRVGRADCRHQAVTLAGGIDFHNVYIPAGGDIPDPVVNEKFKHKLDFVDELAVFWANADNAAVQKKIIVGDLNIAPLEHDVWSHKQLLSVVSHTPIEVEKFTAMQQAGGWVDAMRHFVPHTEKLYSWWSYRNQDWEKSNRGRRLDHIWVSPALASDLQAMEVLRAMRNATQPSDHVPVMLDIAA